MLKFRFYLIFLPVFLNEIFNFINFCFSFGFFFQGEEKEPGALKERPVQDSSEIAKQGWKAFQYIYIYIYILYILGCVYFLEVLMREKILKKNDFLIFCSRSNGKSQRKSNINNITNKFTVFKLFNL